MAFLPDTTGLDLHELDRCEGKKKKQKRGCLQGAGVAGRLETCNKPLSSCSANRVLASASMPGGRRGGRALLAPTGQVLGGAHTRPTPPLLLTTSAPRSMSRYLLAGQYRHYHGEAVNPRYLSAYERWRRCVVCVCACVCVCLQQAGVHGFWPADCARGLFTCATPCRPTTHCSPADATLHWCTPSRYDRHYLPEADFAHKQLQMHPHLAEAAESLASLSRQGARAMPLCAGGWEGVRVGGRSRAGTRGLWGHDGRRWWRCSGPGTSPPPLCTPPPAPLPPSRLLCSRQTLAGVVRAPAHPILPAPAHRPAVLGAAGAAGGAAVGPVWGRAAALAALPTCTAAVAAVAARLTVALLVY